MGVDRAVERGAERQRHGKVPAPRQRALARDLIGAVYQQAVQPHRAACARKTCADRIDPCEQRLERGGYRGGVGRIGWIGRAVAGHAKRQMRQPAVADRCGQAG